MIDMIVMIVNITIITIITIISIISTHTLKEKVMTVNRRKTINSQMRQENVVRIVCEKQEHINAPHAFMSSSSDTRPTPQH